VRAIIQRVSQAMVTVDGDIVGSGKVGLVALVGAHRDDTKEDAAKLADRVWGLRIFSDAEGKMNLALRDLLYPGGSVLAVSNFTVYGETAKNRRPSFIEAAPYERGQVLFEHFVKSLRALGCRVETGVFGAHMDVSLVNDGPVTIVLDTEAR
jgi:D-tyrosyl-tRNA(Tyr) deacylase